MVDSGRDRPRMPGLSYRRSSDFLLLGHFGLLNTDAKPLALLSCRTICVVYIPTACSAVRQCVLTTPDLLSHEKEEAVKRLEPQYAGCVLPAASCFSPSCSSAVSFASQDLGREN